MDVKQMKSLKISMDKISELPADILSFILSLLTMKEAARTSILSHRWRCLWKTAVASYVTLNVDVLGMSYKEYRNGVRCFSGMFCKCFAGERKCSLRAKRRRFIGYIHQILHLDHICMKDSFRIRFYLGEEIGHNIDEWIGTAIAQIKDVSHHMDQWIEMAIAKRCQNLTISLSHLVIQNYICHNGNLYYLFPCLFSSRKLWSSEKCTSLKRCSVRSSDSMRFRSLIDLQLSEIFIDGDSIVCILSNCPNLENLCLSNCRGLLSLDISGPSHKLKHLTIHLCTDLNKIKLHLKSLTRLQYCGKWVEFTSIDVPQLSNVIFRTERDNISCRALSYALGKLSSDVPQMESLMLSLRLIEERKIPKQLPLLANLKKLVLLVIPGGGTVWGVIPLLQASPYLRKLELHIYNYNPKGENKWLMERPCDFPHLHLEEILISGCNNWPPYIEFAKYLVKNTTGLKKLTIFCECLSYEHETAALYGRSKVEVEKLAAQSPYKLCNKTEESVLEQLANLQPPGVELLFA